MPNQELKYTPVPWMADDNYIHPQGKKITIAEVYNRSNYAPAGGYEIPSMEEGKANAQFIVEACNSFENNVKRIKRLEEALSNFVNAIDGSRNNNGTAIFDQLCQTYTIAKQALSEAKQ